MQVEFYSVSSSIHLMLLSSPLLFLNMSLHLLPLPLSSSMSTQPLLTKLQSPLICRNFQQLNAPFLITSVADDFSNNFPDVHGLFSDAATFSGLVVFVAIEFVDFVAFVFADDERVGDGHGWILMFFGVVFIKTVSST